MYFKIKINKIFALLPVLFLAISFNSAAQDSSEGGQLLQPVFPEGGSGLIYLEGEDSVSTNFANEPVSNYGCSGFQAVQLNRTTGLQGGAPFYADFVFYVEEAGEYELWYGGTPPGPADELSPSYSSPFSYRLDGGEAVKVYRENVNVVSGYTPSYYWTRTNTVSLSEGSHRLRIEVSEKRRYDGRYYFYLDSVFFLNRDRVDDLGELPPVFPENLAGSEIDNPFLSISAYEQYIDKNPDEADAYIELSLVYSLLGDYQSALKVLNRAMAFDISDPYPIVLAAKNRLWKGDVKESLALYERALAADPDDRVLWSEAGKVAAWTADYDKAIDFFTRGIKRFPDDMNMLVNLGLTYLWMAMDEKAEETFAEALNKASGKPEKLRELGWIQEVNGYPGYARDVYQLSIEKFPRHLEFYLLLQKSYLDSGQRAEADGVGRLIENTFVPSNRLDNELEIYNNKLNLRDDVLQGYLQRLKDEPGNLELRQELAQTYFWNGMRREAIEQIKYVITTHSYRAAETWGRRNSSELQTADYLAALKLFFESFPVAASSAGSKLQSTASALKKAKSTAESKPEDAEAAAAYRKAQQVFADAVSGAWDLAELYGEMEAAVARQEQSVKGFLAAEKEEDEAFSAVISSSGWSWDRNFHINELTEIRKKEPELASFMLGRTLAAGKNYAAAAEVLSPRPPAVQPPASRPEDGDEPATQDPAIQEPVIDYSELPDGVLYALYEALLFGKADSGQRLRLVEAESGRLYAAYPHLEDVEKLAALGRGLKDAVGSASGVYYEGLEEESADAAAALSELGKGSSVLLKRVDRLWNQAAAVLSQKLERTYYYLEADTFLIRFELGNYYLEERENKQASEQFRRVIAVDPWNISATYKLGVVEQRYGNWNEAMKFYKDVYLQDPNYGNAAHYYNQLARLHADAFSSNSRFTITPAEMSYLGVLEYRTEFNSLLGMGLRYSFDQQRLYRAYTGEEQGYFQVHLVEAQLPFTINALNLKITPHAGVYAESLYYKTDYAFEPDSAVTMGEFFGTLSSYPKYGVSVDWQRDFLTVNAAWESNLEADTFYADRAIIRKNDITLNVNTWFDFDEPEYLGPLTTRTYGRLQLMADDNIKGQIYQDVQVGFSVLSKPIIKIYPALSFNYENSLSSPGTGYYAPGNVIEAKGTVRSVITMPSADWSSAFEGVLWAGSGGYWDNLGSEAPGAYLKAEGGLGLTWVKNGSSYYLNMSTLGTFNESGNSYWEVSLALGTGLKLPSLLAR